MARQINQSFNVGKEVGVIICGDISPLMLSLFSVGKNMWIPSGDKERKWFLPSSFTSFSQSLPAPLSPPWVFAKDPRRKSVEDRTDKFTDHL